jgi:hypothetical protein
MITMRSLSTIGAFACVLGSLAVLPVTIRADHDGT